MRKAVKLCRGEKGTETKRARPGWNVGSHLLVAHGVAVFRLSAGAFEGVLREEQRRRYSGLPNRNRFAQPLDALPRLDTEGLN